jgi:hypothetical protein
LISHNKEYSEILERKETCHLQRKSTTACTVIINHER